MSLLKTMLKAAWYMVKSGLIYGAVGGGLLALSFVLLGLMLTLSRFSANDLVISIRAVALGVGLGGGAGLVIGALDGPVLALLLRFPFPQNRRIERRTLIQIVNALLTAISVCISYFVLFNEHNLSALWLYFIIGCIAGGAFWYATGKFVDRTMPVNQTS